MRTLRRVITDDEADWRLLSLANEKGKFGIELGLIPGMEELQFAFERGIDAEWFTFVDVSRVRATLSYMRIFRLTEAGRVRKNELAAIFAAPERPHD